MPTPFEVATVGWGEKFQNFPSENEVSVLHPGSPEYERLCGYLHLNIQSTWSWSLFSPLEYLLSPGIEERLGHPRL